MELNGGHENLKLVNFFLRAYKIRPGEKKGGGGEGGEGTREKRFSKQQRIILEYLVNLVVRSEWVFQQRRFSPERIWEKVLERLKGKENFKKAEFILGNRILQLHRIPRKRENCPYHCPPPKTTPRIFNPGWF
jgi:hypothetical protein